MDSVLTNGRTLCGWEALGYAVVENAIHEFKLATKRGRIVNGVATLVGPQWTPIQKCRAKDQRLNDADLINFFRDGRLDWWLDALNSTLTAEDIRAALKI